MGKLYAAIGNFYNDENTQLIDAPADEKELVEKVEEIMKRSPMGTVLPDEDVAVLRAYLPAIGCGESGQDDSGSLQGKGVVTKSAEGCGVAVEATGTVEVQSRWHADRKQWSGEMAVKRTGGEAKVKELTFDFFFFSVGQDGQGRFIVLYNEHYIRSFSDPYHLSDFNAGGQARGSRFDISKFVQWGFYMHVQCAVRTNEGSLII